MHKGEKERLNIGIGLILLSVALLSVALLFLYQECFYARREKRYVATVC